MAQRPLLVALVVTGCQVAPPGPALQVLTETARPRWHDALPSSSPIFDGTTVRLRGARGEVLGIEVVRDSVDATRTSLRIDGVVVRGFAVDHAIVTDPSTTMYGDSRGGGSYPDRLTPVDGDVSAARLAYFDVEIPTATSPGPTSGVLTVGDRRIPVELTIEATVLPPIEAAPWVWAYYDPGEARRDVGEAAFAALFRRYGVIASPELTLDTWDARHTQFAAVGYAPVLLPRDLQEVPAAVRAWIGRSAGTGVVPFAIPIDEPRTAAAKAQVRELSTAVRAAGGGRGRFLYAVTQRPDPAMGDAIDVYVSPHAVRAGVPAPAQAWTYNGAPGWAGAMVVDADDGTLRSWGWLAFVHDLPLWYVWDALYWRDRYNRGRDAAPTHDLRLEPTTFDDGDDHGALDGVLAYPGGLPSLRLAQLRRGVLDRMLLEAYARRHGRDAALAIARTIVPAHGPPRWPRDAAAWETLREQLLAGLRP